MSISVTDLLPYNLSVTNPLLLGINTISNELIFCVQCDKEILEMTLIINSDYDILPLQQLVGYNRSTPETDIGDMRHQDSNIILITTKASTTLSTLKIYHHTRLIVIKFI